MGMKSIAFIPAVIVTSFGLASCSVTSISNTGSNALYRGELSESDVLGITGSSPVSLAAPGNWTPPRSGSRILLVQSGAMMPDAALLQSFEKHFDVVTFSGLASDYDRWDNSKEKKHETPPARKLRAAAAAAGAQHIVCVWGLVDSEDVEHATKAVSWVPIAGNLVPAKTEHMRISLKAGIIDTASGRWDSVSHYTPVSKATSSELGRSARRTQQIEASKADGYGELAAKVAQS